MNVLVSQCSYHHEKHNMYLRGLVLAALGLEVKRSKAMIYLVLSMSRSTSVKFITRSVPNQWTPEGHGVRKRSLFDLHGIVSCSTGSYSTVKYGAVSIAKMG